MSISGASPAQPVYLSQNSGGTTQLGATDVAGNFSYRMVELTSNTGGYTQVELDPVLTLQEKIVSIFLTRGDHTTDAQLLDAIYHPLWRWGVYPVYKALERLAKTDKSSHVRTVAEQQARELLPRLRPEKPGEPTQQ